MIMQVGILLWLVALAAVVRLLRISHCDLSPRLLNGVFLGSLLVSIFLLFRPHEEIIGGEDAGSYLNSGVEYARQGRLFYVDPLLAMVPPRVRPDFFYGHAGFGMTKDACLWVRDLDRAVVGSHFQPAYPIAMSVVARFGPTASRKTW